MHDDMLNPDGELELRLTINLKINLDGADGEELIKVIRKQIATHMGRGEYIPSDCPATISEWDSSVDQVVELDIDDRELLQELYAKACVDGMDMGDTIEIAEKKVFEDCEEMGDDDLLAHIREWQPQVLDTFHKNKEVENA